MAFLHKLRPAWIAVALMLAATAARATPSLVVDADSGDVLYQEMPTAPWYPASLTKLMTVYVALSAVREGRITLDTPLMVSPRAAVMPPSKMGFRPGTLVTLDNALKMLMVKSPNDVAITIAEGVSGSVEGFADDMNVYATRLGLHESHFVNPNGLPDQAHMSSARDMALIARALQHDFPEERGLFNIGVLAFGRQLISNHNGLLGRYPGVDGMKTGFTCAAGYNVVESAERNGRHLIVVILGAPSTAERNLKAIALFDRFFAESGQSMGTLDGLAGSSINVPPDMHDSACGRGRRAAIAEARGEDVAIPLQAGTGKAALDHPEQAAQAPTSGLLPTRVAFEPVRVFIGPVAGWSGRIAQAVGTGSKEWNAAPVKTIEADVMRKPIEQARAVEPSPASAGAIEAPSQTPLALVGATPIAPAALATRRFVRSAPSLSLAVGPKSRHRKVAASHKPSAVAVSAPAAKAKAAPAVKTAAVVKPAKHAPPAKKQAIFKPGSKPVAAR